MRKFLPLVLVVFLFSETGFSQVLNGRVMNESGDNAANVSVRFQNRSNSILTNADGTFRITAAKLPDTLVFSAAGYEPYKVVITEKNISDPKFEVVLLNARKELSEVVVIADRGAKKSVRTTTTASRDDAVVSSEVVVTSAYGAASGGAATIYEKDYAGSGLAGRVSGVSVGDPWSAKGSRSPVPDPKYFFADTNIAPRTGAAAKSRILTAGEVNDFNKWKMWEEYSENEFRSMGVFWGMMPDKRYSVQLTDKRFNAIVNEPVFLIKKETNDTVWKAYTDNTGKAELWAGFFREAGKTDTYFIADRLGNKVGHPSSFDNGVNLLAVDRPCGVSSGVDIAFVVDATGSMGDEIEFLKLELEDVIRNTMEKHKSLSFRASSVFYRDKGDEYLTKKVDFNDDLLKTLNFIKLQGAGGGGDTPEALDEALGVALDSLQWKSHARTRLLFLILDAPPHNEAKERIRRLTEKAAATGIRLVPVACSGTDKSTEFLLRSMALATNGTYAFLTNHSGVGNSHIEPTTDKYEVELLGNLLQRIIGQYVYAKDCAAEEKRATEEPVRQQGNILSIKLYPNPTSGMFAIETKKDLKEIFISDFTGKLLMRLPAAGKKGRWQVDISRYPSATYLVRYVTADHKWGSEKVVLIH